MSRWLVALRLARRDALRNRARTLLILVMVALPVTCAVAADTLLRPSQSSDYTQVDGALGSADVEVVDAFPGEHHAIEQISPNGSTKAWSDDTPVLPTPTAAAIRAVLPPGSRVAEVRQGYARIRSGSEPLRVSALTFDTRDPIVAHVAGVASGRLPTWPDEIAVSPVLAESGLAVGSVGTTPDGKTLHVVGVLPKSANYATHLVSQPGAISLESESISYGPSFSRKWYASSPRPVTWEDVRKLNSLGVVGISKAVLADPHKFDNNYGGGITSRWMVAVVGLVSAMTILEIVLLAGPAFAVGARRQQRALAQLAVVGGEPRDARRVVLAGATVIGGIAAVLGVGMGLGIAAIAPRLLRRYDLAQTQHQASARTIVIIAAAAILSAVLAALLPAWSTSRVDPLAVLTSRRSAPRAGRAPLIGAMLLLGIGLISAISSARYGDEVSVAFAGVPTVLGAVLLAPAAATLLSRLAARLSMPLRFAARDASRNRIRTAPAVGAVIAVVAGAVALGTGAASDAAEYRAFASTTPVTGEAAISAPFLSDADTWARVVRAVQAEVPGRQVRTVRGVRGDAAGETQIEICPTSGVDASCPTFGNGYSSTLGTPLLVGAEGLDAAAGYGTDAERAAARSTLAQGGIALFTTGPLTQRDYVVLRQRNRPGADQPEVLAKLRVPATTIDIGTGFGPALAVVPEDVAQRLGFEVGTTSLLVSGPVDRATERRIRDAVSIRSPEAQVSVQRGSSPGHGSLLVLVVLGSLSTLLVVFGTLTATKLALSDAQPEFAALHSVGASPSTTRTISAAYAGLIAFVGAVLGAAAGLVPGIAVAYPLTRNGDSGPYIALPWALLALLIVGVPAIAAGVAALTTRAQLPGYSRGVGA
jgi:putative ABC transport system permease protein